MDKNLKKLLSPYTFAKVLIVLIISITIFFLLIELFPLKPIFYANNVYTKSTKLLHLWLDNKISHYKKEQLSSEKKELRKGEKEKTPDDIDEQKEDVKKSEESKANISNILEHTGNILSKTSILLTIFSCFIIFISLIMGFLGIKWIREYASLRKAHEEAVELTLDNVLLIAETLPLLRFTHIIPSEYFPTLELIHEAVELEKYEKIIKKSKFNKLKLLNSIYYWVKGEFNNSLKLLEDLKEEL